MSLLRPLVARCHELSAALVAHARLSFLALLVDPRLDEQRRRARAASQRIEQATGLEELLARHFQLPPRPVRWPAALRARLEAEEPTGAEIDELLEAVALQAAQLCARAVQAAQASELLEPLLPALQAIGATLPAAAGCAHSTEWTSSIEWLSPADAPGCVQVLRGPRQMAIDPRFAPAFSVLDRAHLAAMESHRAPSFWCLSTREAMAAELCALSSFEHDGLPLACHRDLAKQCWDEIRHAQLFLDFGVAALPDFLAVAPPDHVLLPGARKFAAEGHGLPAPREGNLYQAIWNCSLEERLVLMHIDTEGPGVGGFVRELRSDYFRARPASAERLQIALHDEASHARAGRRWLHHLLPDPAERAQRSAQARLLRGLFLIDGMAQHQGRPLSEALQEQLPHLKRGGVDIALPAASS